MNIDPNEIVGVVAIAALVLVVAAGMAYLIGRRTRAKEIAALCTELTTTDVAFRLHMRDATEAENRVNTLFQQYLDAARKFIAASARCDEAQGRVAQLEAEAAAKDAEIARLTEYQQERIAEDAAARLNETRREE